MNFSISVLTIVKSRHEALLNLIKGLESGDLLPAELIIIHMNEPVIEIKSDLIRIKSYHLTSEEQLPLAAARNKAVQYASSSHLIFIDVDCIPAPNLVQLYAGSFQDSDQLWTGPVRYLKKEATHLPDFFEKLYELSSPDPIRGNLGNLSYELFWSLNFGCSKKVYEHIGGFDAAYQGYGAEDTDFSFTARSKGVPIAATDALAFHQHHPGYDPPLNHFEDIVKNAKTFFSKWSVWPMEGWLRKFSLSGLIHWSSEDIIILRYPAQDEVQSAIKP